MATKIQRSRRTRPSEKAIYHAVTGAGKSRVKRDFFELSKEDERAIAEELEQLLGRNLDREK